MTVLVACEESQLVCTAFRERGHEAYSCDIQRCSGDHPEWHIQQDVIPLLNGSCSFTDMNGVYHLIRGRWDLIIAHPPCTYLSVAANRNHSINYYTINSINERTKQRIVAMTFFMKIACAVCDRIAIENPIGMMNTVYRKPDQIIQPYYFGDPSRKSTCLWLKGLPLLTYTDVVEPEIIHYKNGRGTDDPWHMETLRLPAEERARQRSKTFPGIAKAMAEQWGESNDGT